MARVNFIHFCDSAFTTAENGNLNIIGIFEHIMADQFPVMYPKFAVVANLEATAGKHELEFVFKHEGSVLLEMKGAVESPGPKMQFINNVVNFNFPEEGIYSCDIKVDGHIIGTKSIEAKKRAS